MPNPGQGNILGVIYEHLVQYLGCQIAGGKSVTIWTFGKSDTILNAQRGPIQYQWFIDIYLFIYFWNVEVKLKKELQYLN